MEIASLWKWPNSNNNAAEGLIYTLSDGNIVDELPERKISDRFRRKTHEDFAENRGRDPG